MSWRTTPYLLWLTGGLALVFGVACGQSPVPRQRTASERAADDPTPHRRSAPSSRVRPRSRPAPPPALSVKEAAQVLYPGRRGQAAATSAAAVAALGRCGQGGRPARIRCLLALRYAGDARSALLARSIFDLTGTVVGLEPARRMDGGWRGKLKLVPELLVGRHRRHLKRIAVALRDIHAFIRGISKHLPADDAGSKRKIRYRYRALSFKAFRSVKRATPSAYAWQWSVAYNVNGSLLRHQRGVRQTLFHELFHLNDHHHKDWSDRVLDKLYQRIIRRCTRGRGKRARLSKGCLKPYAPHRTTVRGGVYYAFHPESGVGEYGAELAVRYFLEQRAALGNRRLRARAFKCRNPENARAWRLLAAEFFGGVDLVPACP